jgi:hypothetical protein
MALDQLTTVQICCRNGHTFLIGMGLHEGYTAIVWTSDSLDPKDHGWYVSRPIPSESKRCIWWYRITRAWAALRGDYD